MDNIYDKKLSNDYSKLREDFRSSDAVTQQEFFKESIEGKKVLDFGCGDGTDVVRFARKAPKEIVGVDSSSAMIELAQEKVKESPDLLVKFFLIDTELPFREGYFDVVFSTFVLHYLPDLQESFKEIRRVLKPGGRLSAILNIFEGEAGPDDPRVPIILGHNEKLEFSILRRSESDVLNALQQAGFTDISKQYIDNQDAQINPGYPGHLTLKTLIFTARQ